MTRTARLRLAAFAAALPLLFGGAALAGATIEPHGEDPTARTTEPEDHMSEEPTPPTPPTPSAASRSPRTACASSSSSPSCAAAATETLRFRIVDEHGATVRDFDVEHAKRMHLIVARRDLTGFQHLHPSWPPTAPGRAVRLDAAGSYRLFADFSHDDEPTHARRRPARRRHRRPAPAPRARAAAVSDGGYDVRLDAGDAAARRGGRPALHDHPRRRAGRDRALPRRRRPPRRAARGRPGVPARPPDGRRRPASPPRSRPRAATACSCSSSTTAASRPSPSPRR